RDRIHAHDRHGRHVPGRCAMSAQSPLCRATGLVKEFPSGRRGLFGRRPSFRAVDAVSFEVDRGETLAVVGASGSGKSTTARLVARLMEPTAGSIEFEGEDVSQLKGNDLRAF